MVLIGKLVTCKQDGKTKKKTLLQLRFAFKRKTSLSCFNRLHLHYSILFNFLFIGDFFGVEFLWTISKC